MQHLDEPSQPHHAAARQPAHVAESPWFWFAMFLSFALLALAVIGPKHVARQTRLVRMHEARQQARFRSHSEADADVRTTPQVAIAELVADNAEVRPASPPDQNASPRYRGVSLTALASFLAAALTIVAIVAVYRAHGPAGDRDRPERGSGA